eukprot:g4512.t1
MMPATLPQGWRKIPHSKVYVAPDGSRHSSLISVYRHLKGERVVSSKRKKRTHKLGSKKQRKQQWVQCDTCKKWRAVPHFVKLTETDTWTCEMNRWDSLHSNCEAMEETEADYMLRQRSAWRRNARGGAAAASRNRLLLRFPKKRIQVVVKPDPWVQITDEEDEEDVESANDLYAGIAVTSSIAAYGVRRKHDVVDTKTVAEAAGKRTRSSRRRSSRTRSIAESKSAAVSSPSKQTSVSMTSSSHENRYDRRVACVVDPRFGNGPLLGLAANVWQFAENFSEILQWTHVPFESFLDMICRRDLAPDVGRLFVILVQHVLEERDSKRADFISPTYLSGPAESSISKLKRTGEYIHVNPYKVVMHVNDKWTPPPPPRSERTTETAAASPTKTEGVGEMRRRKVTRSRARADEEKSKEPFEAHWYFFKKRDEARRRRCQELPAAAVIVQQLVDNTSLHSVENRKPGAGRSVNSDTTTVVTISEEAAAKKKVGIKIIGDDAMDEDEDEDEEEDDVLLDRSSGGGDASSSSDGTTRMPPRLGDFRLWPGHHGSMLNEMTCVRTWPELLSSLLCEFCGTSTTFSAQTLRVQLEACLVALEKLTSCPSASYFFHPVDLDAYPTYVDHIDRPICLGEIQYNLKASIRRMREAEEEKEGGDVTMHTCELCGWDTCERCGSIRSNAALLSRKNTCPNREVRHPLVEYKCDTAGLLCDACGRQVRLGEFVRGCRACDWDVCGKCFFAPPSSSSTRSFNNNCRRGGGYDPNSYEVNPITGRGTVLYRSVREVTDAVRLVWTNCYQFNSLDAHVVSKARILERWFKQALGGVAMTRETFQPRRSLHNESALEIRSRLRFLERGGRVSATTTTAASGGILAAPADLARLFPSRALSTSKLRSTYAASTCVVRSDGQSMSDFARQCGVPVCVLCALNHYRRHRVQIRPRKKKRTVVEGGSVEAAKKTDETFGTTTSLEEGTKETVESAASTTTSLEEGTKETVAVAASTTTSLEEGTKETFEVAASTTRSLEEGTKETVEVAASTTRSLETFPASEPSTQIGRTSNEKGDDGRAPLLTSSTILKRGAQLLLPPLWMPRREDFRKKKRDPGSRPRRRLDDAFITEEDRFVRVEDDETPRFVARRLGIDANLLISLNSARYEGLHPDARLMGGTVLEIPATEGRAEEEDDDAVLVELRKRPETLVSLLRGADYETWPLNVRLYLLIWLQERALEMSSSTFKATLEERAAAAIARAEEERRLGKSNADEWSVTSSSSNVEETRENDACATSPPDSRSKATETTRSLCLLGADVDGNRYWCFARDEDPIPICRGRHELPPLLEDEIAEEKRRVRRNRRGRRGRGAASPADHSRATSENDVDGPSLNDDASVVTLQTLNMHKWTKRIETLPHAFVEARDDEKPEEIAQRLGVDLDVLVTLNRARYPGFGPRSKLMEGTTVDLPPTPKVCVASAAIYALAAAEYAVAAYNSTRKAVLRLKRRRDTMAANMKRQETERRRERSREEAKKKKRNGEDLGKNHEGDASAVGNDNEDNDKKLLVTLEERRKRARVRFARQRIYVESGDGSGRMLRLSTRHTDVLSFARSLNSKSGNPSRDPQVCRLRRELLDRFAVDEFEEAHAARIAKEEKEKEAAKTTVQATETEGVASTTRLEIMRTMWQQQLNLPPKDETILVERTVNRDGHDETSASRASKKTRLAPMVRTKASSILRDTLRICDDGDGHFRGEDGEGSFSSFDDFFPVRPTSATPFVAKTMFLADLLFFEKELSAELNVSRAKESSRHFRLMWIEKGLQGNWRDSLHPSFGRVFAEEEGPEGGEEDAPRRQRQKRRRRRRRQRPSPAMIRVAKDILTHTFNADVFSFSDEKKSSASEQLKYGGKRKWKRQQSSAFDANGNPGKYPCHHCGKIFVHCSSRRYHLKHRVCLRNASRGGGGGDAPAAAKASSTTSSSSDIPKVVVSAVSTAHHSQESVDRAVASVLSGKSVAEVSMLERIPERSLRRYVSNRRVVVAAAAVASGQAGGGTTRQCFFYSPLESVSSFGRYFGCG